MRRLDDLKDDLRVLDSRLDGVLAALKDPKSKVGGSDAAAVARERRMLGGLIVNLDPRHDQAGDLRRDYDRLGTALGLSGGSGAAAVVRERRMVSALLEALEAPVEVPLVDQLADRRRARASDSGAASRRRKSG